MKYDFLKLSTYGKKPIFLKNMQLLEGSPEKDLAAIRKDSEITSNSKVRPISLNINVISKQIF